MFTIHPFPDLPASNNKKSWKRRFIQINILKAIYPAYFVHFARGMLLVAGSLYLIEQGENAAIISIGAIIGFAEKWLFGILTEKKGDRFGIFVSLFLLLIGFVGLIISPHLDSLTTIGFWSNSILLGIGGGGISIGYLNIAVDTANENEQTEARSSELLIKRLGIVSGQFVAGTMLSYSQSWYVSISLCLLCLMLVWMPQKNPQHERFLEST
jgi:hypothetical protein